MHQRLGVIPNSHIFIKAQYTLSLISMVRHSKPISLPLPLNSCSIHCMYTKNKNCIISANFTAIFYNT